MSSIKVVYLDQRYLAEPIRLALTIGGIDFEDERISHKDVQERRANGELPFGQVPVVILGNDVIMSQTSALLRWAGQRAGLAESVKCDEIEAALADVRIQMRPQWYGCVLGRSPVDGAFLVGLNESQKTEVLDALEHIILPARFKSLERYVEGPYMCGDALSVCDLSWYNMCVGLLEEWYCPGVTKAVLNGCPKLINVAARVHAHPAVKSWNEEHAYATPPELQTASLD